MSVTSTQGLSTAELTRGYTARSEAWANGCDECRYGIVNHAELDEQTRESKFPLYQTRLAQHAAGALYLCDCRAGDALRAYVNSGLHR